MVSTVDRLARVLLFLHLVELVSFAGSLGHLLTCVSLVNLFLLLGDRSLFEL